jgi:hypothetical protein
MKPHFDLYKKIQELRVSAALLYDRLKANDATKEELGKAVQPFQSSLDNVIRYTAEKDLSACARAAQEFCEVSLAYGQMAKYYIQKQMDAEQHKSSIEGAVRDHMIKLQVTELYDAESSATLVVKEP